MAGDSKEEFFIRPGFGSQFNLIEFSAPTIESFLSRLKPVLIEINALEDEGVSLPHYDIFLQYNSNIGSFLVSIEYDAFIFIASGVFGEEDSESNKVIDKLADALGRHGFKQRHLTIKELAKYKARII